MELALADAALVCTLVAVVLGGQLVASIDDPVNGADEGYLWYGVLETARGRVPVRDFRSYEPGRYWLSVPFLVLGRGLPSVRVAATAVLMAGTAALAMALRAAGHGWPLVAVAVVVVAAWAPRFHKRHDQGVLLTAAAAMIWAIGAPSTTTLVVAGAMAGVAGVIGLNLGLYAGSAAALTWLVVVGDPGVDPVVDTAWMAAAAVVGAAPLWLTIVGVRGFGRALAARRVVDTTGRAATNLVLPMPVPWRSPPRQLVTGTGAVGARVASYLFVVVPAGAAAMVVVGLVASPEWTTTHPAVIGTAVVALPSWHHVLSRADLHHLSTVVAVPLVGVLAFADAGPPLLTAAVAVVVVATSAVVSLPRHPRVARRRDPRAYVRRSVGGRRALWFTRADAATIAAAEALREDVDGEAPWLAVPMTLWILPFLGLRTAVYDSFCVYPASDAAQDRMITEIEAAAPPVAVVGLVALDGRAELRFPATHPRVWSHLQARYRRVDVGGDVPPSIRLLRREPEDQAATPRIT